MKNIIFLISDQMQRKAVLVDSRGRMPNLRELCKDSVDFSRTHASNPICSPARASLITGRLPHVHGMVDCTHTVPKYRSDYDYSLPNLPEILNKNGYDICYYGKWHIERSYDLKKFGIEEYETERDIPKRDLTPVSRVTVSADGYKTSSVCGVYAEGEEVSEEHYIYDKTMDFIDRHKDSGRPFCAFISTYAPHDPYVVPKQVYDMYPDSEFGVPEDWDNGLEGKPGLFKRLHSIWKDLTDEQIAHIIHCYYACCTLVDIQIGRLVSFLKDRDLYDDTLIVVTSDHGDLCGSHGLFCKGVAAYEDAYRIPFVVKFPGNKFGGRVCNVLSDTCDIMPTVLDIAQVERKGIVTDGKTLIPYIEGKNSDDVSTVSEFFGQRYSYTQRVVWYKDFKYIFNTFDNDELYDLRKDSSEMINLSDNPDYREIKKELCKKMWQKCVETGDWSLTDSQYFMHRFAPIGPLSVDTESSDRFTMFNKSF